MNPHYNTNDKNLLVGKVNNLEQSMAKQLARREGKAPVSGQKPRVNTWPESLMIMDKKQAFCSSFLFLDGRTGPFFRN
jgi:hypothetical protein